MKKTLYLVVCFLCFAMVGISQNKKDHVTDTSVTEYIPVEGRSETGVPKQLQGSWILTSGIKKTASGIGNASKKMTPGTQIRRDSVTSTTTVNGETHTTTEINIEKMGAAKSEVTPAQKDKMHVAEKPSINFYGFNETFSGFTGCNKFAGRYKINGNSLTFLNAAPSTKMVCIGEFDEQSFLDQIKKVTAFRVNNGVLDLMNDENVLLSFSRK